MIERAGIFAGAALAAFLALIPVGQADTISYADAVTTLAKEWRRHQEILQRRESWERSHPGLSREERTEGLADLHVDTRERPDVDRPAPASAGLGVQDLPA